MDTASILATSLDEARTLCQKNFHPDAYHEIPLSLMNQMRSHYETQKNPLPVMLTNGDDLKSLL